MCFILTSVPELKGPTHSPELSPHSIQYVRSSPLESIDLKVYSYSTPITPAPGPFIVGFVGLLFPRSSVYKTGLSLCNSVGVLDADYRGEVKFKFNFTDIEKAYKVGDRIGQLVVMPIHIAFLEEVEELSDTSRGTGGWGSSGK